MNYFTSCRGDEKNINNFFDFFQLFFSTFILLFYFYFFIFCKYKQTWVSGMAKLPQLCGFIFLIFCIKLALSLKKWQTRIFGRIFFLLDLLCLKLGVVNFQATFLQCESSVRSDIAYYGSKNWSQKILVTPPPSLNQV